jgi:adenylate cyclase
MMLVTRSLAALLGRSRREARRRAGALLILAVAVAFSLFVWAVNPFQSWEWALSDRLFQEQDGSSNIVVAGIDDQTLQTFGRLSDWPRSLHAAAIGHLREAGASVVAMDLLFPEESEGDEGFAASISGWNVALAVAALGPFGKKDGIPTIGVALEPAPALKKAYPYLVHVLSPEDADGVVRRMPLAVLDAAGHEYPSLAVTALSLHFSRAPPENLTLARGSVTLAGRNVPLTEGNAMRINFVGGADRFRFLSYRDVVDGTFDPAVVRGKIVLIGETATGTGDRHRTPIASTPLPGLYLHANALDTLLRGRFLREAGANAVLLSMLLLGAISALALPRINMRWGLAATLGLAIAYALSIWALFDRGWVLPLLNPLILVALLYVVSLAHRIRSESAARREVRELFGRYISPEVAAELIERADRGELRLGGELRVVTILFADLRGFTYLSERRPAPQVVEYINRCFGIIIGHIVAHGGMINKFGGDAIMALWNAPNSCSDHTLEACRAALAAAAELERLEEADPVLAATGFGFGINTGEALVGNVGSMGRLEYTAIGDCVNLAARICGAAPADEVWVGPETSRLIEGNLASEPLGEFRLKGKEEPVLLFRVRQPEDA